MSEQSFRGREAGRRELVGAMRLYPLPSKKRYGGAGNEVEGHGGSGANVDGERRERRGGAGHGRWQARPEVDGEGGGGGAAGAWPGGDGEAAAWVWWRSGEAAALGERSRAKRRR